MTLKGATPDMVHALTRPTPPERVQWRGDRTTQDKTRINVLAYVDARYVMDTLDAIVLPENWQDAYQDIPGGVRAGIGILVNDEWVWKWDAAPSTDIEGIKGGHSDALKRSGVKWGIARDLYDYPDMWVPAEETYSNSGKYRPVAVPVWDGRTWTQPGSNGHQPQATVQPTRPVAVAAPTTPRGDPYPASLDDTGPIAVVPAGGGKCPVHLVAWTLKPGGVSKTTGKPYAAFYACPSTDRPWCKQKPSLAWVGSQGVPA